MDEDETYFNDLQKAAYAEIVEDEVDSEVHYNSMCENIFAEIARQWLDQNGGRILADVMNSSQRKQPARRKTFLSDEKYPVPPF